MHILTHIRAHTHTGRRHVRPYYSKFFGNVKERWLGRTVMDVCLTEFAANPPSYYRQAITHGTFG